MLSSSTIGKIVTSIAIGSTTIIGAGLTYNQYLHPSSIVERKSIPVCDQNVSPGYSTCDAFIVTDQNNNPIINSAPILPFFTPSGYGSGDLHTAYNLPTTASGSAIPIIGIVDAYDNPVAYSDLTTYSTQFSIPILPQCVGSITSSSVACFKKINEYGGLTVPPPNSTWVTEISLDVQIAHAICQNCSILLVEASSTNNTDLFTAVTQAGISGANVISNSYGGPEYTSETNDDTHFNQPGVVITASSGDSGYNTQYPAASPYVIAVGGTTLALNNDSTYNGEEVWNGTGSGCSKYESKPSWQHDTNCSNRTIGDIAADADPASGVAIYDSYGFAGQGGGWISVGGTSVAAPLIAATFALTGTNFIPSPTSLLYQNISLLHDVINGSNGSCGVSYLCNAKIGYDGPTGNGTPNTLQAFLH